MTDIERIVAPEPADQVLSPVENSSVCFLAFPDSNWQREADAVYWIRFARSADRLLQSRASSQSLSLAEADKDFSYGFVFSRQKKDASAVRGFLQKAVVLVADEAFVPLLQVIRTVGEAFFQSGPQVLEDALKELRSWQTVPAKPTILSIPLGGSLQRVLRGREAFVEALAAEPVPSWLEALAQGSELAELQELLLCGEPVVVLASGPAEAARAVGELQTLVRPFVFAGDMRPFVTMQEACVQALQALPAEERRREGYLLGCTNAVIPQALQAAHVLELSAGERPRLRTSRRPLLPVERLRPAAQEGNLRQVQRRTSSVGLGARSSFDD
jgi:hypothetical protein